MSLFRNENPILGSLTQITWVDGTVHYLVGGSDPTFTQATIANTRGLDVEPILTATSVAITGSVAAIRGNTTVASGTTIASGFLYGVQGKLTVKGTLASANFTTALLGQLDLSAATLTASGPISAIWADMGATWSASAQADAANVNVLQLTDTHTGTASNAALFIETNSTYLMDVSNASYSPWFHAGAPTTLSGSLKINTSAGIRYIALYTTQ